MDVLSVQLLAKLLRFLVAIIASIGFIRALTSLFTPPVNSRARRLKATASFCFICGAFLFVIATLLWFAVDDALVSEVVGFCGIAAFAGFVLLGGMCRRENKRSWALFVSNASNN